MGKLGAVLGLELFMCNQLIEPMVYRNDALEQK